MGDDLYLLVTATLAGGVRAAAPLSFAAVGEVFTERAGVINLGLEGIMLMGAVTGVAVTIATGLPWMGIFAAALVGTLFGCGHAFATVWLGVNQIASGVALIVLGTGLSGFLGIVYVGRPFEGLGQAPLPALADIPLLGPILFRHDQLTYVSLLLIPAAWLVLYKTKWGLEVRAVGEDPEAASLVGIRVLRRRTEAVILGGAFAGVAGAHLSVAYSQLWQENMVAGRGLIALALVILGSWDPRKVYLGALFFGAVTTVQLRAQTLGVGVVSPYLLSMLPYLLTIGMLAYVTIRRGRNDGGFPRALGVPFADRR